MTLKRFLPVVAFFIIVAGCNRESLLRETQPQFPLIFSGTVVENNQLRVTGNQWDKNDHIGIFAVNAGTGLQKTNIAGDADNLVYETTGNGTFYALGNPVNIPAADSPIDIIAYYPFKTQLSNYTYPLNIEEQTDFLYSNNLKNVSKGNLQNNLRFKRVYAKISFEIGSNTENTLLDGLTVTLKDFNTRASFSLASGALMADESSKKTLTFGSTGSSQKREVSLLVLPTKPNENYTVIFQLNDQTFSWKVPNTLESGNAYHYSIKLDGIKQDTPIRSSYMEIPVYTTAETAPHSIQALHLVGGKNWLNSEYVNANTPQQVRNFTVLYDKENRVPYWIAFPLHPMYLASGNRTDDWNYDPDIPQEFQPNLFSSWTNKDLDRGHMMASADRNATRAINRTTFYFTNMVPQNGPMNGGTWATLEGKVRKWSEEAAYDTLYVVTGSILPTPPEQLKYAYDTDGNKAAVPKYLYKVLLKKEKKTGTYTSIAFKMENANTGISYNDNRSIFSVSEMEKETGFTFFPNLPKEVAQEIKQNKNMSVHWK